MPFPPECPPCRPIPLRRAGRWLVIVLWGLLVAAVYALYTGAIALPERFNPWAALNVQAQPQLLTSYKLSRARSDPARCRIALQTSGMQYDLLPDRSTGAGCGFENAVRLRDAGVQLGAALPLSCPMALSFAMWQQHSLQAAAQTRLGQKVAGIEQLGSYACRNVNTGEGAAPGNQRHKRSQHATADALDVAGFTLASGKRISVLRDYQRKDAAALPTPEALFLDDVHAGACTYFVGVLGPDFNAVHRNHFHLEAGGYSMCR